MHRDHSINKDVIEICTYFNFLVRDNFNSIACLKISQTAAKRTASAVSRKLSKISTLPDEVPKDCYTVLSHNLYTPKENRSSEVDELLKDDIIMFAIEHMVREAEVEPSCEFFFDGTFDITAKTKYKQLCILSRKVTVLNNDRKKLSTVVPIFGFIR